jgi:hypothetical protein
VDGDDRPRRPASLRIPAYVITHLEPFFHSVDFSFRVAIVTPAIRKVSRRHYERLRSGLSDAG